MFLYVPTENFVPLCSVPLQILHLVVIGNEGEFDWYCSLALKDVNTHPSISREDSKAFLIFLGLFDYVEVGSC